MEVDGLLFDWVKNPPPVRSARNLPSPTLDDVRDRRKKAKKISQAVIEKSARFYKFSDKLDRVVLHRLWGPLIFAGVVIVVFQSIFTWAQPFMDLIDGGFSFASRWVRVRSLKEGTLNERRRHHR